MGLGLSRSRHVETQRRRFPPTTTPPPFVPRRSLLPPPPQRADTTELFETRPDFPIIPAPSYPSFNAMTGVPPVRYNNYFPPGPYFHSPQPMMMMMLPPPQFPAAMPRAGAPMQQFAFPTPSPPNVAPNYIQPTAPIVASAPAPAPAAAAPQSFPGRLITDWTAGGKISPGFLGPPI